MTIEELRIRIDELDRQLVELLNERARAAQMIGRMKAATSLPVYEPDRERIVYANVRAANKGPLPERQAQSAAQEGGAPGHAAGEDAPETGKKS